MSVSGCRFYGLLRAIGSGFGFLNSGDNARTPMNRHHLYCNKFVTLRPPLEGALVKRERCESEKEAPVARGMEDRWGEPKAREMGVRRWKFGGRPEKLLKGAKVKGVNVGRCRRSADCSFTTKETAKDWRRTEQESRESRDAVTRADRPRPGKQCRASKAREA